jgi:hypothetical protein
VFVTVFLALSLVFLYLHLWAGRGTSIRSPNEREAIVTIVSSEIYLPGALTLGVTLHKHTQTPRDYLVFIPHNGIKEHRHFEMLRAVGWTPILVNAIPLPGSTDWKFVDMLVKLYAWNLTQYSLVGS